MQAPSSIHHHHHPSYTSYCTRLNLNLSLLFIVTSTPIPSLYRQLCPSLATPPPALAISQQFIHFDDASGPSKASEIRSLSNSLGAQSPNCPSRPGLPLLLISSTSIDYIFPAANTRYYKHKPKCKLRHPVLNAPLPIVVRLALSLDHHLMFLFGPSPQHCRLGPRAPQRGLYNPLALEG
jgi:hypothetical protein